LWDAPNPRLFVDPLEPRRKNNPVNELNVNRAPSQAMKEQMGKECLREIPEYQDFLYHFAEAGMIMSEFKNKKGTQNLSEYMSVGEEAFLVLAYCNSYNAWKFEAEKDTGGGLTIHEHPVPPRRFTNDSKGADRYKGWSQEGLKLHTAICKKLEIQRNDTTNIRLKEFEKDLREKFEKDSSRSTRRTTEEPPLDLYNELDMEKIAKRMRTIR
jgi:hypothetical protein